MIRLNKASVNDLITVTLEETKVLNNSTYRFTFTNTTTKKSLNFDVLAINDLSNYKQRYNQFAINTSVVFANFESGQYQYSVLEVESSKVLEIGQMQLMGESIVSVGGYSPTINYKGYNG